MIKGRVSFIISAYNHEDFVEAALQSIVDQTYPDVEIVVVDDGSTDDTLEVIRRFEKDCPRPMIVIAQENRGQAQGATRGFASSTGEYVRSMSSDDVIAADATEWQVADLLRYDADAVYGSYHRGRQYGRPTPEPVVEFMDDWNAEAFKASHAIGRGPMIQCGLFRRSLIEAIGGPDQGHALDDWPVHFAVADQARRIVVRRRLVIHYRIHGDNLSIQRARDLLAWKKDLIRQHLHGQNRRRGLAMSYQYAALNLRHSRPLLAIAYFLRGALVWPRSNTFYRFLGLSHETRERLHSFGRKVGGGGAGR